MLSFVLAVPIGSPSTAPDCEKQVVPIQAVAGLIGFSSCPGVRPGAVVQNDLGLCTLNFLFRGSDGNNYIGTAGHCVLEKEGEKVWAAGGPAARDGRNKTFGSFAYAVLKDDYDQDFSLVRINPGVGVSAMMCVFGGPTGVYTGRSPMPVTLHHYGNGIVIGDAVPGRTHVAPDTLDTQVVHAYGPAIFGDSGSGVLADDGSAVGILSALEVTPMAGSIRVVRLGPMVARAQQVLGIGLTLQTAPRA